MKYTNHLYHTALVSCCIKIYEQELPGRDWNWRISHFKKMACLGIPIYLFACPQLYEEIQRQFSEIEYPHLFLLPIPTQLSLYRFCMNEGLYLPDKRNMEKDTSYYISLMHAKMDFIHHASQLNLCDIESLAWVDFSMPYLFKNPTETCRQLNEFCQKKHADSFFYIPGCWGQIAISNPNEIPDALLNQICWRFCGSFFVADLVSLSHFYFLYKKKLEEFIHRTGKLVWEVNFWAWLESTREWNPTWYSADHNDRLITELRSLL